MKKILTTKHKHWSREKEIRFISDGQCKNVPMVNAQISEIIFGARIPKDTLMGVRATIVDHCNKNKIRITISQ